MSLLPEYPPEILNEIFLYLSGEDVANIEHPILAPYCLLAKYRVRELDVLKTDSPYNTENPFKYKKDRPETELPNLIPLTLPLFLKTNTQWYQPQDLEFYYSHSIHQVDASMYKNLRYKGDFLRAKEYRKLSHLQNLVEVNVMIERDIPRLPASLRVLGMLAYDGQFPVPPQLVELRLGPCSMSKVELPQLLRKLLLSGVELDSDAKLPKSLDELVVLQNSFEISHSQAVDLLYLQLTSLTIDILPKRFILPTTLTTLTCWQLSTLDRDFSSLEKLERLEIWHGTGIWVIPSSVKELICVECKLKSLCVPPLLKSLKLLKCSVQSPRVLDVVYPDSLKNLEITSLTVMKPKLVSNALFTFRIPLHLSLFKLDINNSKNCQRSDCLVDSSIVWPKSIQNIDLVGIGGFVDMYEIADSLDQTDPDANILQTHSASSVKFFNGFILTLTGSYSNDSTFTSGLDNPRHVLLDDDKMTLDAERISSLEGLHIPESSDLVAFDEFLNNEIGDFYDQTDPDLSISQTHSANSVKLFNRYSNDCTFTSGLNNPRHVFLDDSKIMLDTEQLRGILFAEGLHITDCEVSIYSEVEIPSNLRYLTITNCGLTSEKWKRVVVPNTLKSLNLTDNNLEQFVANENVETIYLKGNRIKDFPIWNQIKLKVQNNHDWKLFGYTKLDKLGGAYIMENDNASEMSNNNYLVFVTLQKSTVVYQAGGMFEIEREF